MCVRARTCECVRACVLRESPEGEGARERRGGGGGGDIGEGSSERKRWGGGGGGEKRGEHWGRGEILFLTRALEQPLTLSPVSLTSDQEK